MTLLEQILIPTASLLFLGIAFLLLVAASRPAAKKAGTVPLEEWGGPWPYISGLTLCGTMGLGKFLGVLLGA